MTSRWIVKSVHVKSSAFAKATAGEAPVFAKAMVGEAPGFDRAVAGETSGFAKAMVWDCALYPRDNKFQMMGGFYSAAFSGDSEPA